MPLILLMSRPELLESGRFSENEHYRTQKQNKNFIKIWIMEMIEIAHLSVDDCQGASWSEPETRLPVFWTGYSIC